MTQVWVEGYSATGDQGRAWLAGEVDGVSLLEAARELAKPGGPFGKINEAFGAPHFRELDGKAYYWGCRIFDNEAAARVGYG